MMYLRRFLSKCWSLFHNDRVEEELEREIRAHLALLEDEFLRRGMSVDEAGSAARRAYGGVEQGGAALLDSCIPLDLRVAGLVERA